MLKAAIGLAGCGRMGRPMAQAMLVSGLKVTGFDIRPLSEFDTFAGHMQTDAARFACDLDILLSVVRDADQTDDLLFGTQNLIARAPGLTTLIICSTLSPRYFAGLRDRVPAHITLIDAPMSGAAIAAEQARLSFMLGGTDDQLDPLMPLFQAMGTRFHRMGGPGTGMAAKVLNNLVAASSTATTRLVLEWVDQMNLDPARLLALMHDSSGQTWFGSHFDEIEFARDGFAPDNTIAILKKDVEAAIDGAPAGADTTLPRALIAAIKGLTPRQ